MAQLGYKQSIIAGTDFSFAGKRNFFESHHIKVMDLPYFQDKNLLPNPLPNQFLGAWSLKDAKMFDLAKAYLSEVNQPFALYILNVDTHFPEGFVDKNYCKGIKDDYQGAILCADTIIYDFVKFVQNSPLADNTSIIILGDHLTMKQNFFPKNAKHRFIYNAFINAKFTQKPTKKLTKERTLNHFDLTPLLLDSIGIKAEFFGLGRNPLYHKSLLESEFSIEELNEELKKRNKIYDSFWEVKK